MTTVDTRALFTAELVSNLNSLSVGISGATESTGEVWTIDDLMPQSFSLSTAMLQSAFNLAGAQRRSRIPLSPLTYPV